MSKDDVCINISRVLLLIDIQEEGLHTDQEPFDEPDLCHYDTESQVKLGHLFAQAFKPFLS